MNKPYIFLSFTPWFCAVIFIQDHEVVHYNKVSISIKSIISKNKEETTETTVVLQTRTFLDFVCHTQFSKSNGGQNKPLIDDLLAQLSMSKHKCWLQYFLIKMPQFTFSKLPGLLIFGGPLAKSKLSALSAAIFPANVITGNIWPTVHGQLCWFKTVFSK